MKTKVDISLDKVSKMIGAKTEVVEQMLIRRLKYIGEECITIARNLGEEYRSLSGEELEEMRHQPHQPNYIDDTGNLRQSIGYIVAKDGNVLFEDLKHAEAERLAKNVLSSHKEGIVLIMVAGMEYAEEVQAKGYDVLSSAAITAKVKFLEYVKKMFK